MTIHFLYDREHLRACLRCINEQSPFVTLMMASQWFQYAINIIAVGHMSSWEERQEIFVNVVLNRILNISLQKVPFLQSGRNSLCFNIGYIQVMYKVIEFELHYRLRHGFGGTCSSSSWLVSSFQSIASSHLWFPNSDFLRTMRYWSESRVEVRITNSVYGFGSVTTNTS